MENYYSKEIRICCLILNQNIVSVNILHLFMTCMLYEISQSEKLVSSINLI